MNLMLWDRNKKKGQTSLTHTHIWVIILCSNIFIHHNTTVQYCVQRTYNILYYTQKPNSMHSNRNRNGSYNAMHFDTNINSFDKLYLLNWWARHIINHIDMSSHLSILLCTKLVLIVYCAILSGVKAISVGLIIDMKSKLISIFHCKLLIAANLIAAINIDNKQRRNATNWESMVANEH